MSYIHHDKCAHLNLHIVMLVAEDNELSYEVMCIGGSASTEGDSMTNKYIGQTPL